MAAQYSLALLLCKRFYCRVEKAARYLLARSWAWRENKQIERYVPADIIRKKSSLGFA